MLGYTHALSGAAAGLGMAEYYGETDPKTLALITVTCAGAAVLPDWDHPSSVVSKAIGPVSQAIGEVINKVSGGHRKGTHSLFFTALMGVVGIGVVLLDVPLFLLWLLVAFAARALFAPVPLNLLVATGVTAWAYVDQEWSWFASTVMVGVLVHLLGDALTPERVPFLYPFSRKRYGLGLFTTSTWPEVWIVAPLLSLALAVLVLRALAANGVTAFAGA